MTLDERLALARETAASTKSGSWLTPRGMRRSNVASRRRRRSPKSFERKGPSVFSKTTVNAITTVSAQLAANAGAKVLPRGVAEHTLRYLRNGSFSGVSEEVHALIQEHGYWEVETATTRLIESTGK